MATNQARVQALLQDRSITTSVRTFPVPSKLRTPFKGDSTTRTVSVTMVAMEIMEALRPASDVEEEVGEVGELMEVAEASAAAVAEVVGHEGSARNKSGADLGAVG